MLDPQRTNEACSGEYAHVLYQAVGPAAPALEAELKDSQSALFHGDAAAALGCGLPARRPRKSSRASAPAFPSACNAPSSGTGVCSRKFAWPPPPPRRRCGALPITRVPRQPAPVYAPERGEFRFIRAAISAREVRACVQVLPATFLALPGHHPHDAPQTRVCHGIQRSNAPQFSTATTRPRFSPGAGACFQPAYSTSVMVWNEQALCCPLTSSKTCRLEA